MANELVLQQEQPAAISLMAIIEKVANNPDVDMAKLNQLLEMKERWDAMEARKAFNAAMAQFKKNPPTITKNRHVDYTTKTGHRVVYDHATLDHVCEAIIAALSELGISHRWEISQDAGISVTCILTHHMGHGERTTLRGAPDDSGGKNAIQAIGSTVNYLQRYTLLAACGMAAANTDDDAAAAAPRPGLAEGAVLDWVDAIKSSADMASLQHNYHYAAKAAETIDDQASLKLFRAEAKKAKEALNARR